MLYRIGTRLNGAAAVVLSLVLSGCVAPAAVEAPTAAPPRGLLADVAVAEEGLLHPTAGACGAPVVGCVVAKPFVAERAFTYRSSGSLQAVDVTLTWSPDSPATETLTLSVYQSDLEENWRSVTGSSPLVLRADALEWPAGEVQILVHGEWQAAGPGEARVEGSQAFALQGVLRHLAPDES